MKAVPQSRYAYSPSGKLWPSGDFSYGWIRHDRKGSGRPDLRSEVQRIDDGDYQLSDGWEYHGRGHVTFDPNYEGRQRWCDAEAWVPASEGRKAEPLDLTYASNSHSAAKRPEKYGRNGITSYGRKMVKSGAAILEKMPGKRLTFATVTMPSLPQTLRAELAKAWPEFVRQLLQTLCRWLKRVGLPALVVSCSEIQPGRLEKYSEAYLHLHLVWPNHWAKAGNWAIDVDDLRSWVSDFLQRRGLWCEGAWVNVDTQQVKKSAAGYLAKYMSKGVAEIEAMAADCGWNAIPSQWWNMTGPLRSLVKKYTRSGGSVGRVLDMVVTYVFHTGDMEGIEALSECTMELDGRTVGVGWRGRVTQALRKDLIKLVDAAQSS